MYKNKCKKQDCEKVWHAPTKQDYCRQHVGTKPVKKNVIAPTTKKKAVKKNVKKKTARRK